MMKKIEPVLSALAVTVALAFAGAADATPPACQEAHPCLILREQCERAGYFVGGGKEGRGLWKDCVEPILFGNSITNVEVEPEHIRGCLAKRAERGRRR